MEIQTNENPGSQAKPCKPDLYQGIKTPISYKDSLIGYNGCYGINTGGSASHRNETLAKELDKEWIPSEKTKKLMDQYPSLQICNEEWKKICLPWMDAIVINTLGLQLNPKSLK